MTYLTALQTTLAGEHAACYVLGYLGAQVSVAEEPVLASALGAAYATHRRRRDDLVQRVLAGGGEPVAAEPAYELPDTTTSAQLAARALRLERSCATSYDYLVANATDDDRGWALAALVDAAVRGLGFGGTPETYPGQ